MWKTLLPDEITITLKPSLDTKRGQIRCLYQVDGLPLLEWISMRVLELVGSVDLEHVSVTPEEILLIVPDWDIPYRLHRITSGSITLKVKRKE